MSEEYIGVKFTSVKQAGELPSPDSVEKISSTAQQLLNEKINDNEKSGNISLRQGKGFTITATGSSMNLISVNSLSFVHKINFEENKVFFSGPTPSSESLMHAFIYRKRKDINAIIHFHNDVLLKKLKSSASQIPSTKKELPYGSQILAKEIVSSLGKNNFLIIKSHGFLATGKTPEAALNEIKNFLSEQ